jgi:hypothetical protein
MRGMTVMAHNGATLVRIRQQRLSKRAQKFRRSLGLRCHKIHEINGLDHSVGHLMRDGLSVTG